MYECMGVWMYQGMCEYRSVVRHSIVHRVLLDYLTHCDQASRTVSVMTVSHGTEFGCLFTVFVVCLFVVVVDRR